MEHFVICLLACHDYYSFFLFFEHSCRILTLSHIHLPIYCSVSASCLVYLWGLHNIISSLRTGPLPLIRAICPLQ